MCFIYLVVIKNISWILDNMLIYVTCVIECSITRSFIKVISNITNLWFIIITYIGFIRITLNTNKPPVLLIIFVGYVINNSYLHFVVY